MLEAFSVKRRGQAYNFAKGHPKTFYRCETTSLSYLLARQTCAFKKISGL